MLIASMLAMLSDNATANQPGWTAHRTATPALPHGPRRRPAGLVVRLPTLLHSREPATRRCSVTGMPATVVRVPRSTTLVVTQNGRSSPQRTRTVRVGEVEASHDLAPRATTR